MKVLSFDQAANITGWSFWKNEKLQEYGIITPLPKSARGGHRLTSLRDQFAELIDKFKPNRILLENPVGG